MDILKKCSGDYSLQNQSRSSKKDVMNYIQSHAYQEPPYVTLFLREDDRYYFRVLLSKLKNMI